MTDCMTSSEYWAEVACLAESIVEETLQDLEPDASEDDAREQVQERHHETIDGHEWVTYTCYHHQVLQYSRNDGYMMEELGFQPLTDSGALDTMALAYWALYADVQERLWDEFDEQWDARMEKAQ